MLIVAVAVIGRNRELGRSNGIPDELCVKGDRRRFYLMTNGHPVIMGRKTLLSLEDRPLPKRTNIVLSRQSDPIPGTIFCRSPEEAIRLATDMDHIAFVIGGGEVYQLFFHRTDELWLTEVDANIEGADSFFPEYHPADWVAYEELSGDGWKFIKYRHSYPLA